MKNALMALTCLAFGPIAAHAATLRTQTTLDQPQVRIADLFDEAGPSGARVLGAGPAPGGRIVVEAPQAAAIARQFGVAWRPVTSTERVVIDRPGRLVAREDMVAILRPALLGAGAPADAELEMPGFTAPLVATDAAPQISIEQLDYEQGTGRFTATIAISTSGEPAQRVRLSGRLQEVADIAVPTRRLAAGTVIGPGDLVMARVRAAPWHGDVLRDPAQGLGQALRRLAVPGQPVAIADLGRPMIVLKGARVMMSLVSPGLSLTATGIAVTQGGLGDRISVLNPASGAVLDAEILAPDQVRVDTSSLPRQPSRAPATQVSLR